MVSKKMLLFLCALSLLAANASAFAATYYVDNSCPYNGNGQGASCSSSVGGVGPFNSLANAQSAVRGNQSGNSLLFKRGQTFGGQFTVGAYGSAGSPFTIATFGSGEKPIITGGGANIYIGNMSYVVVDGIACTGATGSWQAGIVVYASNYVTIRNCTVRDSGGTETSGITLNESVNSTVDACLVENTGYNGIAVMGSSSHVGNTIKNCIVHNVPVTGIITVGTFGSRLSQLSIYGNDSYDCKAGMYLNWTDNSEIHDNKIHDNRKTGPIGEPYGIGAMSCSNNRYYRNDIYGNNNKGLDIYGDTTGTYGPSNGNKVYQNWFHGHTQAGYGHGLHFSSNDELGVNNNQAYYNVFSGNNYGLSLDIGSGTSGTVVYNNTFYGNNIGLYLEHPNPGLTFKNNLFAENITYDVSATTSYSPVHSSNSYYRSAGGNRVVWNGVVYSPATVKSSFEPSCQNVDPKLASSSDFHLQSNSPCINTGAAVGLSQDYEGSGINGSPDIGAYEFWDQGPTPPQNLRVL